MEPPAGRDASVPAIAGRRTPFVGRERESAVLSQWLEAAGQGQGAVVLIAGEPGVGKTRLVSEFASAARSRAWLTLSGTAYESEGMPPYLPLLEPLRRYLRDLPIDDRAGLSSGVSQELALLIPEFGTSGPPPSASGTGPEAERHRFFEEVSDLLLRLARSGEYRGLLIAVDDLHWADRSTLLLLLHFARRLREAPVLVIGAYRTVEVEASRPIFDVLAELTRERLADRMLLEPLARDAAERLVRAMSGTKVAPAVLEAVYAKTAGNPFFIEEVVRHLLAEGVDLGSPAVAVGDWGIPEGVRQVIGKRLARLNADALRLLQAGAVLGDGFGFELAAAVCGSPADSLMDALDQAVRAGMLREEGDGYRFGHPLVQRTVYDGLTLARRQRLHLRAAQTIEERHTGHLEPQLPALAGHYRRAGAAGDAQKAIDYCVRAGEASRAVYAYEETASFWHAALELMEEQGVAAERRARLLERLGDLMYVTGFDRIGAIDYLERALKLFESVERRDRAGIIHSKRGVHFTTFPICDVPRALGYFRSAEEALRAFPLHPALSYVHTGFAVAHLLSLRTTEGLSAAEQAMDLAERLGDEGVRASAAAWEATHLAYSGRLSESDVLFERAWATGDRLGHVGSVWLSAWMAGIAAHLLGDPLAGQGWLGREMSRSRLGGGASRRLFQGLLGYWQVESGHLEDARRSIEAAADDAWLYFEGALRFREGDWAQAESLAKQGREVAARQGDRFNVCLAGFDLAKLLATVGRISEAEALLGEGLEAAVDGSNVLFETLARQALALLFAETGRADDSQVHLTRCREILAGGGEWRGLAGRIALAEAALAVAERPWPFFSASCSCSWARVRSARRVPPQRDRRRRPTTTMPTGLGHSRRHPRCQGGCWRITNRERRDCIGSQCQCSSRWPRLRRCCRPAIGPRPALPARAPLSSTYCANTSFAPSSRAVAASGRPRGCWWLSPRRKTRPSADQRA